MINSMRATVTIDDELFSTADRLASEVGLSRSGFYQRAIESYVRRLREKALTDQMNHHLEKHPDGPDPGLESYVAEAWSSRMGEDEW